MASCTVNIIGLNLNFFISDTVHFRSACQLQPFEGPVKSSDGINLQTTVTSASGIGSTSALVEEVFVDATESVKDVTLQSF